MKKSEINKGNELIAKFMGMTIHNTWGAYLDAIDIGESVEERDRLRKSHVYLTSLYRTSWDWLIPVLHKIGEKLQSDPELCKREAIMFLDWDITALNIEYVWGDCVNFIKVYNEIYNIK
jgi:hypothetical protein